MTSCAFPQQTKYPPTVNLTPDEVANEQNYRQPLRPQFHYTPIQGHIGDSTGLIYYRGEYHLFNIYDQWSQRRLDHKQWGHAISTDLIHWVQMPGVLDKLIDNSPGSGSGIVDWNNSSGLRKGPEKTLLIFYTDYKRGTCIAYSRDRGRTWVRHPKNPVLAGVDDIRDPLVFWYSPADEWRMVRYETKGFAFYRSRDLVQWTYLSRMEGFYECPDMLHLPVVNRPGESRWVLVEANGAYYVGNFDGEKFTPEAEKRRTEYNNALYAGQAWKKTPDGGSPAYYLSWMRYPLEPRLTWNGQMSFPVELTLRAFADGIRMCRQPIDEIKNLRISQDSWRNVDTLPEIKGELLDIRAELEPVGATEYGLRVHGQEIRYVVAESKLRLGTTAAPLKLADGLLRLRILMDRSSVEVFADEGQVAISDVILTPKPDTNVNLIASGGKVRVRLLEVNYLESIWL
ncbi:MAG: glycoside hydrolase family 32 protein [Bryobacteraceae bacterium]